MRASIECQLREFISKNLLFTEDDSPVRDDESLINRGVIDSTGIMELVEFVSQQFDLEVPVKEINQENFDSISRLGNYIRRRLGDRVARADSVDPGAPPAETSRAEIGL